MTNSLTALAAAAAIAVAAISTGADAQVRRQEGAAVAGTVGPQPGAPMSLPFAAAYLQSTTYEPVCYVYREQFTDEYGWRVRNVRVCY